MGWVVSTLGVGLLLEALATKNMGSASFGFSTFYLQTNRLCLPFWHSTIGTIFISFSCDIGYHARIGLIINKTIWGKAMKAVAHDPNFARVMGIKSKRVIMCLF